MLRFLIPLCFIKNFFWLIQNLVFLISFIFLFFYNFSINWIEISGIFGCDNLSFGLVLLSLWISGLIIIARENIFLKNNYSHLFIFLLFLLLILLMLTFLRISLFMFYLFFEIRLIPTLFLILGWGYQPERLQAGVYLLFYTLLASLPILIGIFYLYYKYRRLNILILLEYNELNFYLYFCLIFAFLVKMPIFMVHLWLPKAHVEAPVSGSIILAGLLLKLGGYGLLRVFPLLQKVGLKFNIIWVTIRLFGGVLISFICLRQIDIKSLIAYSSVAHMGIVLGGILTLRYWGICGAFTLIIAHGLCSSGLFCLANISYERLGSRRLIINKGLLNFIPSLSFWWFLLCSSNIAAPPTLNLLGEISLLNRIVIWSWWSMLMLSLLSFFRAAYSLYLFSFSQQGKIIIRNCSFSNGILREFLILLLHWLPLNILILKRESCFIWFYLNSLLIKNIDLWCQRSKVLL